MAMSGWFQVAFTTDLPSHTDGILAAAIGRERLMLVRRTGRVGLYDGTCPHRGASLAHGGRLEANSVLCPFHGFSIDLGDSGSRRFCVRSYPVVEVGGLIFGHLGESEPLRLGKCLETLAENHRFAPGFAMTVNAPYALVIENAFDGTHFGAVHRAPAGGVKTRIASGGTFVGETVLAIPPSPWQRSRASNGILEVPMTATAYGAAVVVSAMGGCNPYSVITAATPQTDGTTIIRLSMAFPDDRAAEARPAELDRYMIEQARRGLEMDRNIWEHMNVRATPNFLESDKSIEAFQSYCRPFMGISE